MDLKHLVITGSGIKTLSHLTRENEAAIKQADLVLYLVNEPILTEWIQNTAKQSISLDKVYFSKESRVEAYKKIVNEILKFLSEYKNLCVVIYGHPFLLSNSISCLVKKIDRSEINLTILPSISAFDCLISDLEFDPLEGCLQIDASELINKSKILNPSYHLILWQVGLVNNSTTSKKFSDLDLLKNYLITNYPKSHPCFLYEAAIYPHLPSTIYKTSLNELSNNEVSRLTTLYIPPLI